MKRLLLVVLLCCSSWANAQSAAEAIRAFSMLSARTETGLNFSDYMRQLGEANFAMKEFMDSPEAQRYPDVRIHLGTALGRYAEAGMAWQLGISSGGRIYMQKSDVASLVSRYPNVGRSFTDGGALLSDGGLSVKYLLPFYWSDASKSVSMAKTALAAKK